MLFRPEIKAISALTVVCAGFVLMQAAMGQTAGQAATPASASRADDVHAAASGDPFIGQWKLSPSKSKLSDEMKVAAIGDNNYAFDFGAGKSENIVTDGTDQPGEFGTTLAVTVEGPSTWRVVRKQGARTVISATWEISNNGDTLTDHYTSFKPDGSATTRDYVYKRTAGSTGFAGTWESTLEPPTFELQIQPYEGDGLSFVNSNQQSTRNIKFNGKDYPAAGPNLPAGFTASGHRTDAQTLQITDKIGGDVVDTQEAKLSPDGKTLTITLHAQSQSKPKIYVFDRE